MYLDKAKVLSKNNGKCKLCDNKATRALADNVYNPFLKKEELTERNFKGFCYDCGISHELWAVNMCVGRKEPLYIWELSQDGEVKQL